jgi:two-component system LytT family sensor kinase
MSMPGLLQRRRSLRNAVVAAVACALLAVSQSTNVYSFMQGSDARAYATWGFALALMLPTWALMAAFAPLIAWLARSYTFAPQNRARSAAIHVAAGLVFALVHNMAVAVNLVLLRPVDAPAFDQFVHFFRISLAYLFYQDVLAYGALLAMFLALHYADLRAQLADARLTALRAQLNPHFFFNTLHAVSTLALQGRRDDVAEIVGRLGDLMRTALHEQAQVVPLSAELAFVEDYLAIQRVRFGDQFHAQKTIAPDTLDAAVPSLVLQPILENAVEHGRAEDEGPISVNITVSRRGDDLIMEVTDTGPGFAAGVRREGIGLANTRARLREMYGNRCRFEYGNLPTGGASVRISIPFRCAPAAVPGAVAGPDYALEAPNAGPGDSEERPRVAGYQT